MKGEVSPAAFAFQSMPVSDEFLMPGFEGAEKKMEIIFTISDDKDSRGLRVFGLDHWKAVVATLNGSIIKDNVLEDFDAYLISESSLFVYKDRVVILTCGTTTLLRALPSILETGKKLNMELGWFQFSRKNFLYPSEQHSPHTSFDEEVKFCSEMFSDGHAHVLGPITSDHWYVFVVDRMKREKGIVEDGLDNRQTLNMYMYGMDQEVAQLFMKSEPMILPAIFEGKKDLLNTSEIITKSEGSGCSASSFSYVVSSQEATDRSGIARLMEDDDGVVVHDHLFDPCGYSMNGSSRKDRYWTIHITPEAHCSYVSFETNLALESYTDLVTRVLATFRPRRATVVAQAARHSPMMLSPRARFSRLTTAGSIEGYSVLGHSITELSGGYTVQLVNYKVADSEDQIDDGTWTSSSMSSMESLGTSELMG